MAPSVSLAAGGTLDCENVSTQSGSYVVALVAGNSAQSAVLPADAGTTTTSYCTITGTVPSNWTVSVYGVNIFLANGTVNDGTIDFGSEFASNPQVGYSGNLLGLGTFTNAGTIVAEQDPADSQGAGPDVIVEAPDFVNAGTFQVDAGLDGKGGSAALGYAGSVGGTQGRSAPPPAAMTFDNTGTFNTEPNTTVTFGSTASSGLPFTFANGGAMNVAPTATEVWGTSNEYYCQHQGNAIDLVQEANAKVVDDGSITLYCNTLDLRGGALTGTDQLLFNGGITADFESTLPANTTVANDIIQSASGGISGRIPAGWTVQDIDGANGVLGAAAGTVNDGTIDFVTDGGTLDDPSGAFTNDGTIQTGDGHGTSTTFDDTDLVNAGTITLTVGNPIVDDGNFTQSGTGILATVLVDSGTAANLQVDGAASIGGGLSAIVQSGFAPSAGDSWQILRARSLTGRFGAVSGSPLASGLGYGASYSASSATLEISHVTPTTTALKSSANPAPTVQRVTYTATVTPAPGAGTIRFTDGGTTVAGCGAVAVGVGTGAARCSHTYSAAGSHRIQAAYSGAAGFARSGSATIKEQVHGRVSLSQVMGLGQAKVSLKLGCVTGAGRCRIMATLSSTEKLSGGRLVGVSARTKRRVVMLASASTSIKSGKSVRLQLRCNVKGRALVATLKRLPATLTISERIGGHRVIVGSHKLTIR